MNCKKNLLLIFSSVMLGGVLFYLNSYIDDGVQAATKVTAPTFSKGSGCYSEGFELTLEAAPGTQVYYTTDGSIPYNFASGNNGTTEVEFSIPATGGNVNKIPKKQTPIKYIDKILVKDRSGEDNILCSAENVPLIYSSDPDESWKCTIPTNEQVAKATVIRAIAVDANGKESDVITRTYFVGNDIYNTYKNASVISVVTDPDNLLDKDIGIYREGNYWNKGADWERDAFVEYFEEDGTIPFATTMGIRIHGGYTRQFGQKSFNLYFRDELGGLKNLKNYELIPGAANFDKTEKTVKYKNFMLRNGGNDTEYTKLQDVFIQSLVEDRAFTTQSSRLCVLFLNGEYWGHYNLTEKYSDNYLETEFGVKKENVVVIKNGELDEGGIEDVALYNELKGMAKRDMTKADNYKEFCNMVDIQSFADYFAAEIYIKNNDWPNNNEQLWRTRVTESGNKYADTKWRYMLFDTEYSMNLYDQVVPDGIAKAKENSLFNAVIKNTEFQQLFVNAMMDMYNVNFKFRATNKEEITEVEQKLNEHAVIYKPFMVDYNERFGTFGNFSDSIVRIKDFMRNRRSSLLTELQKQLNVKNQANVTIQSEIEDSDLITINTTTPAMKSGSWSGIYYQEIPIMVKAKEKTGYHFDCWEVTGAAASDVSSNQTTVVLTSSTVTITAKYKDLLASTTTPEPTASPTLMPIIETPKPSATPVVETIKVPRAVISKLTVKKRSMTVKIKKVSGAKGYQIVYAKDKKFKKGKKTFTIKVVTTTIKKLKTKQIYFVKVRAYKVNSKGKKVYGRYSVIKHKKVI